VGLKIVTIAKISPPITAGSTIPCIAGFPQVYPALRIIKIKPIPVLLTVPLNVMVPSVTADKWFLNVDD
jgi:hypothetical protein